MTSIYDHYQTLSDTELMTIEGGSTISDLGGFVSSSWNTLYNSGRDFGRSIMNALIP